MFRNPMLQKKQDIRKFKPQVPMQPSKGQKKNTRYPNRESNLADLLGTDIFGGNQALSSNDKPSNQPRKSSSSNNYVPRKSSNNEQSGYIRIY
jgi:hypothetical protein